MSDERSDANGDAYADVVSWLKDVGRRSLRRPQDGSPAHDGHGRLPSADELVTLMEELSGKPLKTRADARRLMGELEELRRGERRRRVWREAAFLLLLVIAFLQYYFVNVELEIQHLPSLVIFAPPK